MKKLLFVVLALVMAVALVACSEEKPEQEETSNQTNEVVVMTYEEYTEAELDSAVVIEAYVQGKQSWWDNKATVYAQDADGAYFLYEMACSEQDYEKLAEGTKIRVSGYKAQWAGEVEIVDATFEIIEDEPFVATALDVTALLGSEEIINHQNKLVCFKGMTVENVAYKNDEPGDDIYVTLSYADASYDFCVEVYLTGPDTEVYQTVGTLKSGEVVDVEGFLYWYEGLNPHITSISVVA